MISKKEYIHLLSNLNLIKFLDLTTEEIENFEELKKLYIAYCKACWQYHIYPKLDIEKELRPKGLDIINFCKSKDIRFGFNRLEKKTFESGEYCLFQYKGVNITPFIDLNPGKKEFKLK